MFQSGPGVTVSGNNVHDNDIGLYNLADSTSISGNNLHGNLYGNIQLDQGSANITSNTITAGQVGIYILSFTGNTGNSSGTITGNTITGASVSGITLLDQTTSDAFIPTMVTHSNNLSGNSVSGVNNTTSNTVDATLNWWGNGSGPLNATTNPSGLGSPVSNHVTFNPWYDDSAMTTSNVDVHQIDIVAVPTNVAFGHGSAATVTGKDFFGNVLTADNTSVINFAVTGTGVLNHASLALTAGIATVNVSNTDHGVVTVTASKGSVTNHIDITFDAVSTGSTGSGGGGGSGPAPTPTPAPTPGTPPATPGAGNTGNTGNSSTPGSNPTGPAVLGATTQHPFDFTKNFHFGMIDPQVKLLQMFLNNHVFPLAASGWGTPGHETNFFGPRTRRALRKFQASVGLPVTGMLDDATSAYINNLTN